MKSSRINRARWAAAIAIGASCAIWGVSAEAGKKHHGGTGSGATPLYSYAGSGYALDASLSTILLGGIVFDTIHLGPYSSVDLDHGNPDEAHVATLNQAGLIGLDVGVLNAMTAASGNTVVSNASTVGANVDVDGLLALNATLLQATAKQTGSATCPYNGTSDKGSGVVIVGLTVSAGGQVVYTYTGEPAPNTEIPILGLATLVLNEQYTDPEGDLVVNAVHVKLNVDATLLATGVSSDVVISHAEARLNYVAGSCDVVYPPPPPDCIVDDFVTGGGQVVNLQTGARVTFATHGGIKHDGSTWGGFNVKDHGDGSHIKDSGSGLFSYVDPSPTSTTRELKFYCDAGNGVCTITEADKGEPGTSDSWAISAGGVYGAGSDPILHGNVQLHHPGACVSAFASSGGSGSGGSTGGGGGGGGSHGKKK